MDAIKTPSRHSGLDRFLTFILVSIGAIIVFAVITLILINRQPQEPSAKTPGGVVQLFLIALDNQDYKQAYSMLSTNMVSKPTEDQFTLYNSNNQQYYSNQHNTIATEKINGNRATVTIGYYYDSGSIFNSGYGYTANFMLQQEGGVWLITLLPTQYNPVNFPTKY